MFRPSTVRLAQHLPGTRGLKFPDRKAKREHKHFIRPRRLALPGLARQLASPNPTRRS